MFIIYAIFEYHRLSGSKVDLLLWKSKLFGFPVEK